MLSPPEPRLTATKIAFHEEQNSTLVYRGADLEAILAGVPPRWNPDPRPVGRVAGQKRAWAEFEIPKERLVEFRSPQRFALVDDDGAVATGCILSKWNESTPGVLSCRAEALKIEWQPAERIVLETSFPTANPPFHRDCHCVLDDGRISVGGGCVSGDCDCRSVDGLQAGSAEALAWAAAQRKDG